MWFVNKYFIRLIWALKGFEHASYSWDVSCCRLPVVRCKHPKECHKQLSEESKSD